jgi:hypothetical protein
LAGIEAIRAGLASWDWIYGKTPKFSIASNLQDRGGGGALSLQLRNGGEVLFDPASGIRNRFFDLGSQTYIFLLKSSKLLCKLAQIFFFASSKIK